MLMPLLIILHNSRLVKKLFRKRPGSAVRVTGKYSESAREVSGECYAGSFTVKGSITDPVLLKVRIEFSIVKAEDQNYRKEN